MINPITLDFIDGSAPYLNATNMNILQTTLEAEVDLANKYNGLTNVSKETVPDYPKGDYIVTQAKLRAISNALTSKGVTPSGLWGNVPQEIMQCGHGSSAASQIGAIKCRVVTGGGA